MITEKLSHMDIDDIIEILSICTEQTYDDWRNADCGSDNEKVYDTAHYIFGTLKEAIEQVTNKNKSTEINNNKIKLK